MRDPNLFQPSLQDGDVWIRKSFDVNKLVYVGFFGGVIPILVLGTLNAKWLRLDKRVTYSLLALGIAVFVADAVYEYTVSNVSGSVPLMRISGAVFAILYQLALRKKFHQHRVLGGTEKPLLKLGLLWIVIGIIVEILPTAWGVSAHG